MAWIKIYGATNVVGVVVQTLINIKWGRVLSRGSFDVLLEFVDHAGVPRSAINFNPRHLSAAITKSTHLFTCKTKRHINLATKLSLYVSYIYIFLLFIFSSKLPVCVCVYIQLCGFQPFIYSSSLFYLMQSLYTKETKMSILFPKVILLTLF